MNSYKIRLNDKHFVLNEILQSRGLKVLPQNMPLWQLKLTSEEYCGLKDTILENKYELRNFGIEAAICYAEWWRRDYCGNIPSKEEVALGIGLDKSFADALFDAARMALKINRYQFIHSKKGTEYFRTLLNQGGLPVTYIKNTENDFGSFKRFLTGLVKELASINIDWNDYDTSIIHQFNCVSYLGNAFKNENIYDVAFQIAHAIISDDNEKLPYDDNDSSLAELTRSLKNEYGQSRKYRRMRPFSLHWKLFLLDNGVGQLYFNMDVVKDVSSGSIPGLDYNTCYSFDVFVAGVLVGKYSRKTINYDEVGEAVGAIYTRTSIGITKDILWNGEPVVEVKIRCNNDQRIFLTIAGCYPPNFMNPQVFQMLEDSVYVKSKSAHSEINIVVYTRDWVTPGDEIIEICGEKYGVKTFTDSASLENIDTGEKLDVTNKFTSFTTEFSGNYIDWIEEANYKLMTKIPIINVFDKEKERVPNIKTFYRERSNKPCDWMPIKGYIKFRPGLVDLKVNYPDGHFEVETFYYVGDLSFKSQNESAFSTEISCVSAKEMHVEMEETSNLQISILGDQSWRISKLPGNARMETLCNFRIYNYGYPTLKLSIPTPFDGVVITDIKGNVLANRQVVSLSNLSNYQVISHGKKNRKIDVSYYSNNMNETSVTKHLKRTMIEGIVPLSDYQDLIVRMFILYGINSFDRSSSVILRTAGNEIFVRRFVLDSTIENGMIILTLQNSNEICLNYEGSIFAIPLDESVHADEFNPVELIQDNDVSNKYRFPEDFSFNEVIVFSGAESKYRIIPKYYNLHEIDYDTAGRQKLSKYSIQKWISKLKEENVMGNHWIKLCKMFKICSSYDLPFSTHNGFKAISHEPDLLVKFIFAMWIHGLHEVLRQDIEYFEQEMVIAFHWIPADTWNLVINETLNNLPDIIRNGLLSKMTEFLVLLQDIFDSTLSPNVSSEFCNYINGNKLDHGNLISYSEINEFKTKINGISDTNNDLPIIEHNIQGNYYSRHKMLIHYRIMLESAMCAAENTSSVQGATNLFSKNGKENARIINFYRRYFREIYNEIFLRTLKIISNNKGSK